MRKYPLNGKGLVVGIILLFFLPVNVSSATQRTSDSHHVTPIDRFSLHSVVDVTWDVHQSDEPLDPMGIPRIVTLNVSSWVYKDLLGQVMLWYCTFIHKTMNVTIEVTEKPDFCTTNLSTSQLSFPVKEVSTVEHMTLTIAANKYAPAEPFAVEMKFSIGDVVGPLGFLTLVKGFDFTLMMSFNVGYRPQIVVTPEYTYLETSPGTAVIDPINVTNLGNHITRIDVDFIEVPQNWTVSISPPVIEIPVNESFMMNLSITPPLNFYGIEAINVSFTPSRYPYIPGCEGPPTYITITVNVEP